MPTNYPGNLDNLANPDATDQLTDPANPHASNHTSVNDAVEALQAKLGIGATAQSPVVGRILGGIGIGQSQYRQIVNADVSPGAIDATQVSFPVVTAGGPRAALTYTYPGPDINGVAIPSANTWTDVITLPAFTVDSASSLISVSVQMGIVFGGGGAGQNGGRLLLDGVTGFFLGGGYHGTGSAFNNPGAGGSTVWLGSLSTGSHTLKLQVLSSMAGDVVYLRPLLAGFTQLDYFKAQVIEHKLGGQTWTPRGTWSSSTSYGANDVVTYNGSSYVSIQTGTNQVPSSSPTYWVLLSQAGAPLVWKGPWVAGTAYVTNDIVTHGGSTYVALQAGTGQNPSTASTYWALMVSSGSMVNPMTTADDIIVGGTSGVPTRVAKGAVNQVFGVDATGVLGYRQITTGDILDGTILNADIADGTINGGTKIAPASMVSSNFAGNSIHGSAIQTASLTGTQILDGSIGANDLASGAAGYITATSSSVAFAASGAAVWAFDSSGCFLALNTVKAGYVTVTAMGAFKTDVAGTYLRFGVMRWGDPGPPTGFLHYFATANTPHILAAQFTFAVPAGDSHYYTMAIQCIGGGYTVAWHADGSRTLTVVATYQ